MPWSKSQELVSIHECLWRNVDRFEYLAVMDVDEIIVPQVKKVFAAHLPFFPFNFRV